MRAVRLYLFPVLYITGIFLGFIDSYKNPNTVQAYLSISSGSLLFALFTILIIFRLLHITLLPKKIAAISLFTGIILFLITSFLGYVNFNNYPNFIYSKTLIHIEYVFILSLFLLFSGVISRSNLFFKKNYKLLLFLTAPLLLYFYYWYGFFPLNAQHQIAKEDHLIENFQFVTLALSGILSLAVAWVVRKKNKLFLPVFLLMAVGLFFVAGDEISWGQRIFGIATPDSFIGENVQGEITLHNAKQLHGITPFMFMAVGFYGSFMWVVGRVFKKKSILIPQGFLFPFFFAGFFYNFFTSLGPHHIGALSEPTELMLYLGVFFYLLTTCHIPLKKK